MHFARKLFLLAAMAMAALTLTATSASAAVTVLPEVPIGACGTVIPGINHTVTGGCDVEFSSTGDGVPLHAYIPAKTTISNCEVNLEARMGVGGVGYVTAMSLTAPHGGAVPCTRAPCDEPLSGGHSDLLWPVNIVEHGPANEEAETVFCLRPLGNHEGSAGFQCEIHLDLRETTNHVYELGNADENNGTEVFCENNPPNKTGHAGLRFPVSIEPHLVTSGTERIEIQH